MTADGINSPETLYQFFDICLTEFENDISDKSEVMQNLFSTVFRLIQIASEKESKAVGEALLSRQNFKRILDEGNMEIINYN